MKKIADVMSKMTADKYVDLVRGQERENAANARLFAIERRENAARVDRMEIARAKNLHRKEDRREFARQREQWRADRATAIWRSEQKEMVICEWCGMGHLLPVVRDRKTFENSHCQMCRAEFGTLPDERYLEIKARIKSAKAERAF